MLHKYNCYLLSLSLQKSLNLSVCGAMDRFHSSISFYLKSTRFDKPKMPGMHYVRWMKR